MEALRVQVAAQGSIRMQDRLDVHHVLPVHILLLEMGRVLLVQLELTPQLGHLLVRVVQLVLILAALDPRPAHIVLPERTLHQELHLVRIVQQVVTQI
jgi:hypothetical protein